jgi:hypothetical protein
MMRPTTLAEHLLLIGALHEYLDKRAPDALFHDDYSIMEAASAYVGKRYEHDNPVWAFKVQDTFNNIKLALALVASDIHINDVSQPEEVSNIQKGEPTMQQYTDNGTTMPESKRAVLTQAAIDWAKLLGYKLTKFHIDKALYHLRCGEKVVAIEDVRADASPAHTRRTFNLITGNGFSDFIDGRGITYTELPAAMGLKQAKDIVDMLEANI